MMMMMMMMIVVVMMMMMTTTMMNLKQKARRFSKLDVNTVSLNYDSKPLRC